MNTFGKCVRCGVPFDDHKLPPVGSTQLPICIPERKR